MPDDIKTKYYKYKGIGTLGIVFLGISGACVFADIMALVLTDSIKFLTLKLLSLIPFIIYSALCVLVFIPVGIFSVIYGFAKAKAIKNSYFSYNSNEKNRQLEMCFSIRL